MLYFLTCRQHMYTVQVFQEYTNATYLKVVPHEELTTHQFYPEDIVIFCDIDRCNDEQLEELKTAYNNILKTGCRILNNPSKVLRRYQLLRGLYSEGINNFQVYRLLELPREGIRFPVFLRDELNHSGPRTGLIHTYGQLELALTNNRTINPLVCEFIDVTIAGLYHKYGAFILDGKIIPRHFFLSDAWSVKSGSGDIDHSKQLEIDYVKKNPHEEELRRIAGYAHVEFGRIDYAVTEKGIQVFEINTNPTIIDDMDVAEGNQRHLITHWFIDTISDELKSLSLSAYTNSNTVCIIDTELPINEGFYERLVARMVMDGIVINYCKKFSAAPKDAVLLLAESCELPGIEPDRIVLGIHTINRKERMEVAEQVIPKNLIARWASPANEMELAETLLNWGVNTYVLKYDWSYGRRGVKLLYGTEQLCKDYDPDKDIVMEYLDDDPYTYKAELCCGVLLNTWLLQTVPIPAANFNEFTGVPIQYILPEDIKQQLERLSVELMRYGSGYISIDMMMYKGEYKIIEINTTSIGRNISWRHFGNAYLDTYPEGLKRLLANLSGLPTFGDILHLNAQKNKILPLQT
jgi:hypothetical protein